MSTDVDKCDAGLTEVVVALTRPIVKWYFRSEVRGLENIHTRQRGQGAGSRWGRLGLPGRRL